MLPRNAQSETPTGQIDDWLPRNGYPYRFTPIFFGEDDPPPSGGLDRTLSKVAVALLERGTPLAKVIDLVPIALIAAGIFLAL